jgi:hypothetical protein
MAQGRPGPKEKFMHFKICVSSLLTMWLCLAGSLAQQTPTTVHHRFRIFLHPGLAQGLERSRLDSLLSCYVEDLNTIFSKNTCRRFDFDPAIDLVVTDSPPAFGYYPGDLPEGHYDLWAIVTPASQSSVPYSHGGNMSFAEDGSGVAAGLYWDAVHDRTALSNSPPDDWALWNYWRQIHNLAHEVAHVFGAAVGEYYTLRYVQDTTGEPPLQDLQQYGTTGTEGPYWSEHADYWTDPMLMWTPYLPWSELIRGVRFSQVSAAMINSGYRRTFPLSRYVPDLSSVSIRVQSWLGEPIPQTPVKVWKMTAHSPFPATLVCGATNDANGEVRFSWNAGPDNEDNLILIKAWPDGLPPLVKWVSFYDAQEARMVFGKTNLVIPLHPPTTNPPLLAISRSGQSVTLGWSWSPGFIVESTDSLENPGWNVVPYSPTVQGLTNYLSPSANETSQLYRMRRTWSN